MKKQLTVVLIALMGLTYFGYGQAKKADQKFGIKWHGFVKADYMYDTRQNVTAREGHFLLFPSGENIDIASGNDLNSQANLNILAVQTRLTGKISGPDFFGMKTSGVIEGAFFGQANANINSFRLRHAFVKLSNDKFDIIMGQYWSPLFVTAVYPGTYSFNTGVPFQPFARNPQIRITTKGNVRFIGVIYSERDFASRGPAGTTSTYLRNSGFAQVHAQLQFGGKEFLGGFGVNLKPLRPELGKNTITNTTLISYMKAKLGSATFKLEVVYGENMSDELSISGLAEAVGGGYTANKTLSVWSELSGKGKSTEWGIFTGYSKNNGFNDPVGGAIWGLAPTMDHAFRFAPRVGWFSGKMKIGTELEFTSAQYGELAANNKDISTTGFNSVNNVRLLVTAIYGF
ncbi:MAG: hypothetical protein L3J45_00615 [Flavobacteriaceae bacterium]|nr:hypothetical protein [Flavobacteriaceae bacterium]